MTTMVDVSAINTTSIVSHEYPASKDLFFFFFNTRAVFKNSTFQVWLMERNSGSSVYDSALGTSCLHVCLLCLCSTPESREHFLQRKGSEWVSNEHKSTHENETQFQKANILHEWMSSLPAESHIGWGNAGKSRTICFLANTEVNYFHIHASKCQTLVNKPN